MPRIDEFCTDCQSRLEKNPLSWFRDVIESQNETNDAQEFMESLKMDLFSDMVFVFTPKGDVIELPRGSVPFDILPHFGGHPMAAGLTISLEHLDELRDRLQKQASEVLSEDDFIPIFFDVLSRSIMGRMEGKSFKASKE